MIKISRWSKEHVVEGIRKVIQNDSLKNMNIAEFGTYRGESLQLIENTFYAYQFPVKGTYGFDSFEGLPREDEYVERFYLFQERMFNDITHLYSLKWAPGYIKCWFNQLNEEYVKKYQITPFCFVHIDGDLYISAKDTLSFLFSNNLVVPGTVIAYDEFKSTSTLESGGESKATFEICDKFKVEMTEFFRNVYEDHLSCWQNAFIINSIGEKSSCNLLK